MKITSLFLAALITTMPVQYTLAQNNPFLTSDELDKTIRSGLHSLYAMEFEKAEKIFNSIEKEAKEHPMVAFGKASLHWWRLSVYVLESDAEESAPFLKAVDECIQLSREKIDRGDPTGEALLTLGGAYGLLGRWQATNQKWMDAYFTGKRAIKYLRRSLKTNPEMKDANMGLGIFDYYVATLPAVVRVLAFLGSGGDSRVGLQELETAAHQGTYATTPSKLFLVDLYSNQENKPEKAFELLGSLRKEYPVSPFIHMLHIITAYNNNRIELLEEQVKSYEQFVASGTYRPEFTTNSHFVTGMLHFKSREWDEAISHFDQALQSGTVKNPFYTWSQLYKAFALDAQGKREPAIALYKNILSQTRRWGSHDSAKKRLSKPFKGEDSELEKIRL